MRDRMAFRVHVQGQENLFKNRNVSDSAMRRINLREETIIDKREAKILKELEAMVTPEEKKAEMETKRLELEKWKEESRLEF